jgi:hypothetical protein
MTINKLHKLLGELIAQGYGRRDVCIDKASFSHNLESDGCVILLVTRGEMRTYHRIDDDGGIATNKDGTERYLTSLVLTGEGESSFPTPASREP